MKPAPIPDYMPSVLLEFPMTGEMLHHLETVRRTGLWGRTIHETAERLLCDRIRQELVIRHQLKRK